MSAPSLKRERTVDVDDIFASSDEELGSSVPAKTDIPVLDAALADRYPGMAEVHERFHKLMNMFQYAYVITMNFETLLTKKKKGSPPVHMMAPYKEMKSGKFTQCKLEPDMYNDRVYHKDVVRTDVRITQFAYNKRVHDCINQANTVMAQEFKTVMGMLKIPDSLKFIVRHHGHYHMVLFSNTSIYSRNAYKKSVGETFKRRIASSNRNTKAAGQLDTFLHMLYLLSGEKQIIGVSGEHDDLMKQSIRDIMRLKPKADEFAGIRDKQFDSVSLMQEDGGDELCDLNIPQGETNAANVPLPEEDDDLFVY